MKFRPLLRIGIYRFSGFFPDLDLWPFSPKIEWFRFWMVLNIYHKFGLILNSNFPLKLLTNLTTSKIENIRWRHSDARSAKVIYTRIENTMCIWSAKKLCTVWAKPEVASMSGSKVMIRNVFFHPFRDLDLDLWPLPIIFGVGLENIIVHQRTKFERNQLSFNGDMNFQNFAHC